MRKFTSIVLLGFLSMVFFSFVSNAFEVENAIDSYYNGLAEILEDNISKPNDCVMKIGFYLLDQMETVIKVKEIRSNMYKITYKKTKNKGLKSNESVQPRPFERETPGQARFKEAMADFEKAYPGYVPEINNMNIHDILSEE
jgi:hypothetical protein